MLFITITYLISFIILLFIYGMMLTTYEIKTYDIHNGKWIYVNREKQPVGMYLLCLLIFIFPVVNIIGLIAYAIEYLSYVSEGSYIPWLEWLKKGI